MNSAGLRKVLMRRWYLVIVGLLIAVGLTFAASTAVPVKHEADAAVVLLPPLGEDPTTPNPYLGLAGYSSFADVFARAVMDTSSVAALKAAGVTDPFTVARDLTTSAPIIRVTVTSPDAGRAIKQMQMVLDSIPDELVAIQKNENVPTASMFRSKVITQDEQASAIRKSQMRAMIAAGAVGMLITVWGTVWIDSLLTRRSEKARSRHRAADDQRAPADDQAEAPDGDALDDEADSQAIERTESINTESIKQPEVADDPAVAEDPAVTQQESVEQPITDQLARRRRGALLLLAARR